GVRALRVTGVQTCALPILDAVLELVRAGVGVAVVPSAVVDDGFRITRFTAPGLTRTVRLASRRDVEPSRAVRALRDAVTGFLDEASRVRPLITVPVGKRARGAPLPHRHSGQTEAWSLSRWAPQPCQRSISIHAL